MDRISICFFEPGDLRFRPDSGQMEEDLDALLLVLSSQNYVCSGGSTTSSGPIQRWSNKQNLILMLILQSFLAVWKLKIYIINILQGLIIVGFETDLSLI